MHNGIIEHHEIHVRKGIVEVFNGLVQRVSKIGHADATIVRQIIRLCGAVRKVTKNQIIGLDSRPR